MKRLVRLAAVATAVLVLISLTQIHQVPRPTAFVSTQTGLGQTPEDVARMYLSALLSGDFANAEAVSSPLLTQQLASAPPSVHSLEPIPPRIDLLTLDRQSTTVDLAAELSWPDGRLAAMRIQLAVTDGAWKVIGVQP